MADFLATLSRWRLPLRARWSRLSRPALGGLWASWSGGAPGGAAGTERGYKPRLTWLNTISTVLVVVLLFLAGQNVGGTIAYFTNSQDLAGNQFGTSKAFAPTESAAVAGPSGQITVSWSKLSWATQGYSVRRSTLFGGPYSQVGTTGANTTTFTDTAANGLVNGTTYYYVVRGISQLKDPSLTTSGLDSAQVQATSDSTQPTVSSTVPAEAATSISTIAAITVTFSEAMNQSVTGITNFALVTCSSATCGTVTGTVNGSTSWNVGGTVLTFTPTSALAVSTWHGIRLTGGSGGAADLAGNTLNNTGCLHLSGSNCYRTFQTGASGGATSVSVAAPADNATGVGRDTNIILTFNGTNPTPSGDQTTIQNGFTVKETVAGCFYYPSTNVAPYTPRCGTNNGGTGVFTWTGTSMQFNPRNRLRSTIDYTWSVVASGGTVNVNTNGNFTTGTADDNTGPTITSSTPANGTTGVSPNATVTIAFNEAMSQGVTESALSVQKFAGPGCAGALTAVSGTKSWTSNTTLVFTPSANLVGGSCYQGQVSNAAVDTAGNALQAAYTGAGTFTVGGDATLTSGSLYYPGASITATGTAWTTGSGTVDVKLDGAGSVLASATPSGGSVTFSGATAIVLPTSASTGSHTLSFSRTGFNTVTVPITIRAVSRIVMSANPTDISPGQSSVITVTVYDNGVAASNAGVGFTITNDPDGVGSLSVTRGTTNGSGQTTVTLSTNATPSRGVFDDITVTGATGTVSGTAVIKDPPPLSPTDPRLSAGPAGLTLSWGASGSHGVTGYKIALGTKSGQYDVTTDVGSSKSYSYAAAEPGTTYYAVVRAYNANGALSQPTGEVNITMPRPTATPTAIVVPPTAPPATATAVSTATAMPTATAVPAATRTPTAVPVPPTATPAPTRPPATATAVPLVANAALTPTVAAVNATPSGAASAPTTTVVPTVAPATATPIAIAISPTAIPVLATAQATMGTYLSTPTTGVALASPTPAGSAAVATSTPRRESPTPTVAPALVGSRTPTATPAPSPTIGTVGAASGSGSSNGPAGQTDPKPAAAASASPLLGQAPRLLTGAPLASGGGSGGGGAGASIAPTATPLALPATATPIALTGAVSGYGSGGGALYPSANQPTTSSTMPGQQNALYPSAIQPSPSAGGPGGAIVLYPSAAQPTAGPMAGVGASPTPSPIAVAPASIGTGSAGGSGGGGGGGGGAAVVRTVGPTPAAAPTVATIRAGGS